MQLQQPNPKEHLPSSPAHDLASLSCSTSSQNLSPTLATMNLAFSTSKSGSSTALSQTKKKKK